MSGYRLNPLQGLLDSAGRIVGLRADANESFLPPLANNQTEFSNITSSNLQRWRRAMGGVRNASGRARLALVGDSTTAGTGAAGTGTTNAVPKSYPTFLANLLNTYHVPASAASSWGKNMLPATDPRVTAPNWIQSTNALNGNTMRANAITDPLSFNPGVPWDTAEVWYVDLNGCGTFTINVDGGAALATITPNGAGPIKKATITRTLGTGVLGVARTGAGGQLFIAGVMVYDSTSPKVDVLNLGWHGSTVGDWATTSASYVAPAFSPVSNLQLLAPDLSVVCLTINDAGFNTDLGSYKANLQAIIAAALVTGDAILMSGVPSSTTSASIARQAMYLEAARELAFANNLPFINLTQRWGSYDTSNALGLYADTLHPLAIGYADIATAVAAAVGAWNR